jgi:predicted restriction endonuclease
MAADGGDDERPRPDPTSMDFYMRGLEEAPAPFLPVVPTVAQLTAIYRNVLEAYGWTCALTGEPFDPTDSLHPLLQVTAIRPLREQGMAEETNFIAMTLEASHAFERGHVTVGADMGIIVDVATIDRAFVDKLRGVLRSPAGRPPDPEALRWHRIARFASTPPAGWGKSRSD